MILFDHIMFSIHWIIAIISSFHVFIFSKQYDIYYISLWAFIVMHWFFMKGECILTYIHKKAKDPTYIMGNTPGEMNDMKLDNIFIYYIFIVINILTFICMILVFYRNKDTIPLYMSFTSLLLILIYINLVRQNNKEYIVFIGFLLFISAGITYTTFIVNHFNIRFIV